LITTTDGGSEKKRLIFNTGAKKEMNEKHDYGENEECLHLYWDIDRTNFGICCVCKEERQFSGNGNSWNTIRPGVPRRPETKDNSVIHDYYTQNREAIARDFFELGLPEMLNRWKISKGTWPGLKKEWIEKGFLIEKSTETSEKTPPVESVKVILHVALPPLPELKDDWPESLKEKWFDTYNLALKTGKGIGE
jgi:hypothetical protein